MSLAYKISLSLSASHNPELRCAICTAARVTLFALVLHLNFTALSPIRIEYAPTGAGRLGDDY